MPSDTIARDPECRRPPRRRAGRGAERRVPYRRVDARAARRPESRRTRPTARAGGRGPLRVDAMAVRVRTKIDRRNGPEERLTVMRTAEEKPEIHYALSNAGPEVTPAELVRVRSTRRRIEGDFEAAAQEAGPAHYEVRSRVGWHPHVTLFALGAVAPVLRAAPARRGKRRR